MQFNAKTICLSHNQVVPGSSPGGTTRKPCFLARFFFVYKAFFNLFVLFFCKERQLSFTGVVKKICFKKIDSLYLAL